MDSSSTPVKRLEAALSRIPGALVVARIGALAGAFVILEQVLRSLGTLPAEAYRAPVIATGLVARLLGLVSAPLGLLTILAVLVVAALVVRSGGLARLRAIAERLASPWSDLEHGAGLRILLGIVAAVAAWAFSTYDHNLYFDQAHLADRVLLVALALGFVWRPVWVLAFVPFLVAMVGQLDHPMGGYPWTEINFLIRLLTLFGAAFLIRAVTGWWWVEPFLVVACCLVAVNYWFSGLGKMRLGWISHRHLNLLVLGAYANGWLAFLEPATVVRISEALTPLNTPLMLFTLVVEWGAIVILLRRWTLVGFLFCAMGLHVGIFAYTGMFFWKWIVLEAAFLWFLLRGGRIRRLRIFTPAHFVTSVALIVGCTYWVTPTNLSWYDTPLTYAVRLDGVGSSGVAHQLPTRLFTPYSDTFFLGLFTHLSSGPQLTSVMGAAWIHAVADSLVAARTPEEVFEIERGFPDNVLDESQNERFDEFVRGFVGHLNARRSKPTTPALMKAPPHLWSFPMTDVYADISEPIERVRVWHVLTFYDGESYSEIDRRLLREITVP